MPCCKKIIDMIKFHDMKNEMAEVEYWDARTSWDEVRCTFEDMGFYSIINEKSWQKVINTFACLG